MKRMKSLLSVVLALALIFSLSLTVFAAGGNIIVAEPGSYTYEIYKVFDLDPSDPDNYIYSLNGVALDDPDTTSADESNAAGKLLVALQDPDNGFHDLILTQDSTDPTKYIVKKTDTYSAADFATWLANHTTILEKQSVTKPADTTHAGEWQDDVFDADEMEAGVHVAKDGYYFITYSNGAPYALTTVDSKDVQIQNKRDIPFDKEVYDEAGNKIDGQSVEFGDTLTYQIIGKVADVEGNTQYNYLVWDKLGDGLKLDTTSVKIYLHKLDATGAIDPNEAPTEITSAFATDTLNQTPITSTPKDTIWVNTSNPAAYTDTKPSLVVNVDMMRLNEELTDPTTHVADLEYAIIIEYDATVTKDLGVLENTAHLVSNDLVKDAQTQNYTSKLTIDKYETGNASQKLAGAEFILFKLVPATESHTFTPATVATTLYKFTKGTDVYYNTKADGSGNWYDSSFAAVATAPSDPTPVMTRKYYKNDGTEVTWVGLSNDEDETAITDATSGSPTMTVKTTGTDGAVSFTGLEDGTYYLIETKAPAGYVKLETPVEVVVNGKSALDPNNTVENDPTATENNQNLQLTNVSHIANTPGSVLPSTGGRGTTMLYMAGLGMMLAAGAFLIFRRRAEAGK